MNKAPRFGLNKEGLVLFGKPLSFLSVATSIIVAAVVVVGGISLGSSNPFSPDLAWSERSYDSQQAYDSSSYEVQEENKSDNQLLESDETPEQDLDNNDLSQSEDKSDGSVDGVVAGDDEVAVSNGDGNGDSQTSGDNSSRPSASGGSSDDPSENDNPGNPGGLPQGDPQDDPPSGPGNSGGDQGGNGGGSGGPGGTGTSPGGDNEGGGQGNGKIDRDENLYSTVSSSELENLIGEKTSYVQIQPGSEKISYKDGILPSVRYGTPLTRDSFATLLADTLSSFEVVVNEGGKKVVRKLALSDIKLGDSTDTSADSDVSYVIGDGSNLEHSGNTWLVPVNIKMTGVLARNTTMPIEAYDADIIVHGVDGQENKFKVSESDYPNGFFPIPEDLWKQALAQRIGPDGAERLFLGWSTLPPDPNKTNPSVGDGVKFNQGDEIHLYLCNPTGYKDIPSWFKIAFDENGPDAGQKLVHIDQSAVTDSKLEIPEGVNSISLDATSKLDNVASIFIPSSVTWIDVDSILSACPNLEKWEIKENARYSVADGGDNCQVLLDNGAVADNSANAQIISILPSRNESGNVEPNLSISLPSNVDGFGESAFSLIESNGINLTFTIESADILLTEEAFAMLPWQTAFLVGSSVGDAYEVNRAYCSLLSSIYRFAPGKNIEVNCQRGASTGYAGGTYKVDPSGAVVYKMNAATGSYRADDQILAYVPDLGEAAFTLPGSVTVLGTNAFVDAKNVKTVQIPAKVRAFCDKPFGTLNLEALIINAATELKPIDSSAMLLVVPADSALNIRIFLGCEKSTPPTSADEATWKTKRLEEYNLDVERFLPVTEFIDDTSGTIVTDPKTGALYLAHDMDASSDGKTTYTLLRVPKSAKDFTFLAGTTAIAQGAFSGCLNLALIDIPDTVDTVEDGAFAQCSGVEVIHFNNTLLSEKKGIAPASLLDRIFAASDDPQEDSSDTDWLNVIGASVDAGCEKLKHVGDSYTTTRDGDNAFYTGSSNSRELVALLSTTKGAYTLLPNTETIGNASCKGCVGLKTIEGLGAITAIGDSAFNGCSALSVSSSDLSSVRSLGNYAFAGCGISGSFTLPSKATYGTGVFSNNKSIDSVVLDGNYATLGDSTFAGCTRITTLTITEGSLVQSTGTAAFKACSSLGHVEVNGSVATIGASTFEDCSKLDSLSFQNDAASALRSIDASAFSNCVRLKLGLLQFKNLKNIGDHAFYNTFKILSIKFPASLETIGDYAFATAPEKKNETGLASVALADNSRLRSIGAHAFENAIKLNTLDIGQMASVLRSSDVSIGESAFEGCVRLTQAKIPLSVTNIGNNAFRNCSQLNTVSFGSAADGKTTSALRALGSGVFSNCSQLKVVDLSNTQIDQISKQLFSSNTALIRVILPNTVNAIQEAAFAGCTNLKSLALNSPNPPKVDTTTFDAATLKDLVVSVPADASNATLKEYQSDPSWKSLFDQNDAVTSETNIIVATKEFTILGATYTTDQNGNFVLIKADPDQVSGAFTPLAQTVTIAKEAFKGCTGLTMVHVPSAVKRIEQDAFAGCSSLVAFSFEASEAPWMADNIFGSTQPSSDLSVFIYGNNKTLVSFNDVVALKKLHLTSMGDQFITSDNDQTLYCDYLDSNGDFFARVLLRVDPAMTGLLNIDTETSVIYNKAAKGCAELTETTVPAKVASLGNAAFMGATSLQNAWLNNTNSGQLKTIGSQAFEGCTSLQNFNRTTDANGKNTDAPIIPMSVATIGSRAFAECDSLAKLQINGPVKKFPEEMMAGCDSLAQVSMGETNVGGLEEIGARCYKDCVAMTTTGASLTVFTGLKSIGEGAYSGCANLALANFPKSLNTIGAGAFNGCSMLTAIAFNGAAAPNLRGTGLENAWENSRVFVPQPHWSTYETAFKSAGLRVPVQSESYISESYRAISGNIYAELTVVSATEGTTAFLAPTKATLASGNGAVAAYSTAKLTMTQIGPGALQGIDELKSFDAKAYCTSVGDGAFKDCANLEDVKLYPMTTLTGKTVNTRSLEIGAHAFENTPSLKSLTLRQNTKSIGSYAFARCATDFTLDLSLMTNPASTDFGDHVFGETLPMKRIGVDDPKSDDPNSAEEVGEKTATGEGESEEIDPEVQEEIALTIKVKDSAVRSLFIAKWGNQLMEEYDISRAEMEALFVQADAVSQNANVLSAASTDEDESSESNVALIGDNEESTTDDALGVGEDNVEQAANSEASEIAEETVSEIDNAITNEAILDGVPATNEKSLLNKKEDAGDEPPESENDSLESDDQEDDPIQDRDSN